DYALSMHVEPRPWFAGARIVIDMRPRLAKRPHLRDQFANFRVGVCRLIRQRLSRLLYVHKEPRIDCTIAHSDPERLEQGAPLREIISGENHLLLRTLEQCT